MPSQEEIDQQQALLTAHRRTLAHCLKQQAILGEAYVPPGVTNCILEARNNILRIKQILRGWNVSVDNHPDDGDIPLPQAIPTQTISVDRVRLRNILTEYFNEDGLRDLCFELNIDYESLSGESKAGKTRELVRYVEGRGLFDKLVDSIQYARPDVAW